MNRLKWYSLIVYNNKIRCYNWIFYLKFSGIFAYYTYSYSLHCAIWATGSVGHYLHTLTACKHIFVTVNHGRNIDCFPSRYRDTSIFYPKYVHSRATDEYEFIMDRRSATDGGRDGEKSSDKNVFEPSVCRTRHVLAQSVYGRR